MDIKKIKEQALKEIQEEDFRTTVEKEKRKIREKKPWYYKIFPYKIIFIKR